MWWVIGDDADEVEHERDPSPTTASIRAN